MKSESRAFSQQKKMLDSRTAAFRQRGDPKRFHCGVKAIPLGPAFH
jgi:hypothetical protein